MQNTKILIVDDENVHQIAIMDIIDESKNDYELLSAFNGEQALEIALKEIPDLIISDWEMPVMNGIEFIKKLKNDQRTVDIPVIMCTGIMTSSENLKTALSVGAVDYIRKPIDKIELIARINSMLSLSESYQKIKIQKKEIAIEKEKSEELLLNILPKKIVAELTKTGKTEPELFHDVTVFFSDFVGFTEISGNLEPKILIDELNKIFTEFDKIMEKNHCERIKTIGDAYLAVCGMPESNINHAENITNSAIEIINFLKHTNKSKKYKWEIRIGIHSGSLTGGVVGTKKYIYDIFGDTVNTASRMESNSLAGKINISEKTYNILANKFKFTERSLIEVKGLGLTKMYFINH